MQLEQNWIAKKGGGWRVGLHWSFPKGASPPHDTLPALTAQKWLQVCEDPNLLPP